MLDVRSKGDGRWEKEDGRREKKNLLHRMIFAYICVNRDMKQTLVIDIINEKAIKLIKDMELLKLIRVRSGKKQQEEAVNWAAKYKGAMQKQSLKEVDDQLYDLRSSWE